MKLLPYGPRAVLAEFTSIDEVMAAAAAVRGAALPGVIDVVPAARTVMVTYRSIDMDRLAQVLDGATVEVPSSSEQIRIPVRYDGADLDEVARMTGLSADAVIALHSGATYRVAFCGFRPGFAYLVGLPDALRLARRSTPRPRVPAGSVAIADEFSAVYPSVSPGGWHLIGTTDAVLWDPSCEQPALLVPGAEVVFDAS